MIQTILIILAFLFVPIKEQSVSTSQSKYQFKNDSLSQTLVIVWLTKNKLSYDYSIKNIKRNIEVKSKGIALNPNPDMDPEIDEDESDGGSYPSIEYISNQKGCTITIRIELDNKQRAVILSGDCPKYANQLCPISSLGVLRILK